MSTSKSLIFIRNLLFRKILRPTELQYDEINYYLYESLGERDFNLKNFFEERIVFKRAYIPFKTN